MFRDHGKVGLEAMPTVGPRLANVIIELVKTRHCGALDRLRGEGIAVLMSVPTIGLRLFGESLGGTWGAKHAIVCR